MIVPGYLLALSISLVAIALAGIATNRNFIMIMLGVELIFIASTIVLVSSFSSNPSADPGGIFFLFSIWSVASVEVITVIAFYVYMKSKGFDFDVSKLSKFKW